MAEGLSDQDVDRIAEAVFSKMQARVPSDTKILVKTTVQEMTEHGLAVLGINVADSKQLEAFKADFTFMRSLRMRSERVGIAMSNAIANAFALGLIALFLWGFLSWVRGETTPTPPRPPLIK